MGTCSVVKIHFNFEYPLLLAVSFVLQRTVSVAATENTEGGRIKKVKLESMAGTREAVTESPNL